MNSGVDLPGNAAVPAAFTGAVSFIQQHAGHGIGINDIAAAVRLTPRAVQYLFRQQLNTTPTEYLRRVRLHRAHRDLTSGDRSTTTVTEIAQRWGFAHAGRFAMLYRQTYGESPHDTLKTKQRTHFGYALLSRSVSSNSSTGHPATSSGNARCVVVSATTRSAMSRSLVFDC